MTKTMRKDARRFATKIVDKIIETQNRRIDEKSNEIAEILNEVNLKDQIPVMIRAMEIIEEGRGA